jgi:hypothetical protein
MTPSPKIQSTSGRFSFRLRVARWFLIAAVCWAVLTGLISCAGPSVTTPTVAVPSPVSTSVSSQPTAAATAVAIAPTETAIPTPVTPPPTPPCIQPTLTLGTTKFRVETIARAADGSIPVPQDKPDVAYWVAGTNARYVFALSPTASNLALKTTLKSGDAANIRWGDCSTDEYVVNAVESGSTNDAKLFDQSTGGITVLIQPASSAEGIVITGGRPQAQATEPASPTEENAIQAELSFLETKTSPDGKTLTLSVAVKNAGDKSFTLSTNDISLTVGDAAPAPPLGVDPALPQEVKPGASETFHITFAKPAGNTAVFKLLTFSADIYF